jgi:hypothetical protein
MLTAIISTRESERLLVPTLAALVPGATAGVLTDVIVADANSRDDTERVADIAGCKFFASDAPLGTRLREASRAARSPWLMFLRAGAVPDPTWIGAVERFIEESDGGGTQAATFRASPAGRSAFGEAMAALRALVSNPHRSENGLLIHRRRYDELGGHVDGNDPETALMRKLGRRQITLLGATVRLRT